MSQYDPYNEYGAPVKAGMPAWAKVLIGLVISGGVVVVVACAGLIWLGVNTPETFVVTGSAMKSSDMETINDLGLLEPGEQILFFYSDAMVYIEKGMYFLTDRKLVVYTEEWAEPAIIVPFDEIAEVTASYDDSFLTDSTVWVTLDDRTAFSFPVSSDGGGDLKFVEALKSRIGRGTD